MADPTSDIETDKKIESHISMLGQGQKICENGGKVRNHSSNNSVTITNFIRCRSCYLDKCLKVRHYLARSLAGSWINYACDCITVYFVN